MFRFGWRSLILPLFLGALLVGLTGCVPLPASSGAGVGTLESEEHVLPRHTVSARAAAESHPGAVPTDEHAAGRAAGEPPSAALGTPAADEQEACLALPGAFHYRVTFRSVSAPNAAPTDIVGRYRDGDWAQIARLGLDGGSEEELVVVAGTAYGRSAGESVWTRWPTLSFDMAYGLASPFTVLRLYPLADERASLGPSPVAGTTEATTRVQASFLAPTIHRLFEVSIAALTGDAQTRSALEAQVAPFEVQQTINYWIDANDRVHQAAAILLAADQDGQPAPWLEATWEFWGYDDPAIAVGAPTQYRDALEPTEDAQQAEGVLVSPTASDGANLIVRVFASPGVLADRLAVTVYPAGESRQPLDWRADAEARFSVPPGTYDVVVQMDYAEERLPGLAVPAQGVVAREVVFDFGTLELSVTRGGSRVPAEIVIFPAGDRENWLDWRSENPASVRLRAGKYDIEVATAEPGSAKRVLEGVEIRPGEVTARSIELGE